jgi:hypothetical protein
MAAATALRAELVEIALLIVVLGSVALALGVDIAALVAFVRRRWR